jgi:hypothetical protein
MARNTSRCSAAQLGASPVAPARKTGGLPGTTFMSSSDAWDIDDILISF